MPHSIQNFLTRCKVRVARSYRFAPEYQRRLRALLSPRDDIFMVALILLIGFGGFGLGRLSKIEESRTPVKILGATAVVSAVKEQGISADATSLNTVSLAEGQYVASVNSDKYHHPWCSGAQRIKEENKIWFATAEEARGAGYEPAANCKGL